jgi:hypothetical protein
MVDVLLQEVLVDTLLHQIKQELTLDLLIRGVQLEMVRLLETLMADVQQQIETTLK